MLMSSPLLDPCVDRDVEQVSGFVSVQNRTRIKRFASPSTTSIELPPDPRVVVVTRQVRA